MKPYYHDDTAGITIYHADCRDVLPTLGAVDAVITDPPYGLGKRMQGGTWGATRTMLMSWDHVTPAAVVCSLVDRAPIVAIWGGNYYPLPPTRGWLSWFKPDAPRTMADFELGWTNLDQNARQLRHTIAATNAERVGHPTQKPLRVMQWTIQQVKVKPGAIILDPFMGSGTTLRAAKDAGCRAIGIELDERWCERAARRLQQEVLPLEAA